MIRYVGDMDDRMWGANRLPGRILGGMPIAVAHEFLAHFVPGYGQARTIRTMTNVFSTRQREIIDIIVRVTSTGEFEDLEIPRADAHRWLEENYPNGYRLGLAR